MFRDFLKLTFEIANTVTHKSNIITEIKLKSMSKYDRMYKAIIDSICLGKNYVIPFPLPLLQVGEVHLLCGWLIK